MFLCMLFGKISGRGGAHELGKIQVLEISASCFMSWSPGQHPCDFHNLEGIFLLGLFSGAASQNTAGMSTPWWRSSGKVWQSSYLNHLTFSSPRLVASGAAGLIFIPQGMKMEPCAQLNPSVHSQLPKTAQCLLVDASPTHKLHFQRTIGVCAVCGNHMWSGSPRAVVIKPLSVIYI